MNATVAALVLALALASGCADSAGGVSGDPDATVAPDVAGRPGATRIVGRWTSSLFEDPFEAELESDPSGALKGRVCGPDPEARGSLLGGPNCGALTSGWMDARTIHFDFALPWSGMIRISYQFVGAVALDGKSIAGIVVSDLNPGSGYALLWTLCPAERRWCPEP